MFEQHWFKKLSSAIAVVGVSIFASLPVLAQYYYPPSSFFQPTASTYESEDPCLNDLNVGRDLVYNLKVGCFQELLTRIERAKLSKTLAPGQTYTILAPQDEAFKKLPQNIRQKLSKPENLEKVLKYHIVLGSISEQDIKRGGVVTIEGNMVKISGYLIDRDRIGAKLNNAMAGNVIKTSNGYIVPIDTVLLPPDL